jgi:hypothetical protein
MCMGFIIFSNTNWILLFNVQVTQKLQKKRRKVNLFVDLKIVISKYDGTLILFQFLKHFENFLHNSFS